MEPRLLLDACCELAECPRWDEATGRVLWTDIPKGRIHYFEPRTGNHGVAFDANRPVGGFALNQDGSLILFMDKGAIARASQGALEMLLEEIELERNSRFNDVEADPQGRVFCGTMPSLEHPGTLYRYDPGGALRVVKTDLRQPNGIGFSPDLTQMYVTSTKNHEIIRYGFDQLTGNLSGPTRFADVEADDGVPDGLCVDLEGCIWSARYGGNRIVRYAREGDIDTEIELPPRNVTSMCFGGPEMRTLYITSAAGPGAGSGGLFAVDVPVAGMPTFASAI